MKKNFIYMIYDLKQSIFLIIYILYILYNKVAQYIDIEIKASKFILACVSQKSKGLGLREVTVDMKRSSLNL